MKRKETEWVNPLIHRPDSVYIFPQKQPYHNKFSDMTFTKISEINARMQKKSAELVDLQYRSDPT